LSLYESIHKPDCAYNDSQRYYDHYLQDGMNYILENYEYDNYLVNQKASMNKFADAIINRQKHNGYTDSISNSCHLL